MPLSSSCSRQPRSRACPSRQRRSRSRVSRLSQSFVCCLGSSRSTLNLFVFCFSGLWAALGTSTT
jgi:hypothetical protein